MTSLPHQQISADPRQITWFLPTGTSPRTMSSCRSPSTETARDTFCPGQWTVTPVPDCPVHTRACPLDYSPSLSTTLQSQPVHYTTVPACPPDYTVSSPCCPPLTRPQDVVHDVVSAHQLLVFLHPGKHQDWG